MKIRLLFSLIFFIFCRSIFGQTTDSLNSELTGYWVVKSVKFNFPVDLNKDGKKSADAMDEYTDCQKDQQLELLPDMSAKMYAGTRAKDCKGKEEHFTWKVVKRMVRDSRYANGQRIINEHMVVVLVLKATSPDSESMQFKIEKVAKKTLAVKAEIRDGSDSTSEALIELKREKK